jgi:biotin operon repressor
MDRRHCVQYLRTQVDRLQDERYRQDARPSIANELQIAQRDLKQYTSDLRKKGYNI